MNLGLFRTYALVIAGVLLVGCSGEDAGTDDSDLEDGSEEVVGSTSQAATPATSCAGEAASSRFPFNPDRVITINKVRSMTCAAAAEAWRAPGTLASRGWVCVVLEGNEYFNRNKCTKGKRAFWYTFRE